MPANNWWYSVSTGYNTLLIVWEVELIPYLQLNLLTYLCDPDFVLENSILICGHINQFTFIGKWFIPYLRTYVITTP